MNPCFTRRIEPLCVVLSLSLLGARAQSAPQIILQPVSANVAHVISGQEITIAAGGPAVEVTLELRVAGWATAPGAPELFAVQIGMDPSGYLGANATPPNPGVDLLPKGYEPGNLPGNDRHLGFFMDVLRCNGGANDGLACVSGAQCTGGSCDDFNPSFVLGCCDPAFATVTNALDDYVAGAISQVTGVGAVDTGDPADGYLATLILTVPAGAAGSYEVGIDPGMPPTFLLDPDSNLLSYTQVAGVITISLGGGGFCNDGNLCTIDTGTVGNCVFTPTYNAATHCCNPQNGAVVAISDGNACTSDSCNAGTGQVAHTPVPSGTSCGFGVACVAGGSCNGAGICVTQTMPDGTVCDDGNACTALDYCAGGVCFGTGSCGPSVWLRPVSANVSHTIVGQEITIGAGGPGVEVTLELRLFGWGSAPGTPELHAAQVEMDPSGYLGTNAAPPNPGVDLVPKGYDPTSSNGRDLGFFMDVFRCDGGANDGQRCTGDPQCGGGTCNDMNPAFVLACCEPSAFPITNNLAYMAATISEVEGVGAVDTGNLAAGYLATLILEVPAGADGAYTIRAADTIATFLADPDLAIIPITAFIPSVIRISGDAGFCNDGNPCTNDSGMIGNCTFTANYNVATQCCNPQSGVVQAIDDGNDCTLDSCAAATGTVTHVPAPDGTACDVAGSCIASEQCVAGVCTGVNICEPTMWLQPRSSTGMYAVVGEEIFIPEGGVEVTFDVMVRGWGSPNGQRELYDVQFAMDSSGYLGANATPPNPGFDLIPKGYDPLVPPPGERDLGFFMDIFRCTDGAVAGARCEVDGDCAGGTCDSINPAFALGCCDPVYGVNTHSLDFHYVAGASSQLAGIGAVDPYDPDLGYLATLILQVPQGASGSYTLGFNPTWAFARDQDLNSINFTPLPGMIRVATAAPPPTAAFGVSSHPKNRYISFTPQTGGMPAAYRVELISSEYFPAAVGLQGWAGPPDANGLSQVLPLSTPLEQVTRVWDQTVVHVGDCEIVPVATYAVSATTDDGQSFSSELFISTASAPQTKYWGDIVGVFTGTEWTAPNGFANINDVVAGVQEFQRLPSAPHISMVDVAGGSALDPCLNRTGNFMDVFFLIKAMQGNLYPAAGPDACPGSCP